MDISTRMNIVKYENFCHNCQFWTNPQDSIPCDDCLSNPAVVDSHRPTEFKPTAEWLKSEERRRERERLQSKSRLKRGE